MSRRTCGVLRLLWEASQLIGNASDKMRIRHMARRRPTEDEMQIA